MEIIQREKSPETRRLVDRRLEIARPGMMRRRYDQNAQRTIWVPSRPTLQCTGKLFCCFSWNPGHEN